MLVWLTLPFYAFCGFRSVAVNNVYKLHFSTFIFAVLLLVLSRLSIMFINTTFLIFEDGGRPPFKIFKCSKYQLLFWRAIHYYLRTYAKISVCVGLQNAYFNGRVGVLVKLRLVCQFIFKMIKICEFDQVIACSNYFARFLLFKRAFSMKKGMLKKVVR